MHALWNLMARRQRSELLFFCRMYASVTVAGLIPMAISEFMTHSLTPTAWWCLLGSGICGGVYAFFLGWAYQNSDFTIVYPVARALPVLLVGWADVLRGRSATTAAWVGMILVATGCFLAPLHSFREFHIRRYFQRASLWMILAALGTVGYSLLDKLAAESLQQHSSSGPATAARYGYVFFAVSSLVLIALQRLTRSRPATAEPAPPQPASTQLTPTQPASTTPESVPATPIHAPADKIGWQQPILAGALSFASYWLILWAYQLINRVSYVVAFRQLSIIIGVAIAFALYREKGLAVRLTGAILITLGLVLVGVWGK